MQELKVLVPDERVAEFYEMFGRWLAGADAADPVGPAKVAPWADTDDDLTLAKVVWAKLSDRAKALFSVLMDQAGRKISGEQLAADLDIPNGKYGVAGVLAWPGRHCAAVGRGVAVTYEDGPVGGSANYWMTDEVAALFRKARDDQ